MNNSPELRVTAFSLAIRYVYIRYACCFFRHNAMPTLNRLQFDANITFYMHWKPKNSFDSLYCNIPFIAEVWNQTHVIAEICLRKCRPLVSTVKRGIKRKHLASLLYCFIKMTTLSSSVSFNHSIIPPDFCF